MSDWPSLAAQPLIGTIIGGRYEVLEQIGQGGMAQVFEVEHRGLGRRFALKLLRPDLAHDARLLERFEREARAVARLESPHIVGIVDYGVLEQGTPYFVMERLRGSDLRQLLTREGILPVTRAVHLVLDACRGLSVAHAAGIVHRDLKPENLFVTRDAHGQDLCKVLDFGIAKLTEHQLTVPNALVGTTRYMAPEQIASDGPVGASADIFALGVILFECLIGRLPFDGDTVERVLFKIMSQPTPSVLELRPELEPALAELIERMLAKAPEERPASVLALAQELTAFAAREPGATVAFRSSAPPAKDPLSDTTRGDTPGEQRARPRSDAPTMRTNALEQTSATTRAPLSSVLVALAVGAALSAIAAFWLTRVTVPPALPSASAAAPVSARAPAPEPLSAPLPSASTSTSAAPPRSTSTSARAPAPSPPPSAARLPLFFPRPAGER